MARTSTVGGVTGDIFKSTFILAAWTYLWWCWNLDGISASKTLPEWIHIFYF